MKTRKSCSIVLIGVGLWLLTFGALWAEGTATAPRIIELVSGLKSAQGNLVELVCLEIPAGAQGRGIWTVQVRKITGTGSERKEELLTYGIKPGETKPIGFGTIVGAQSEDRQASYEIVSIRDPRLF